MSENCFYCDMPQPTDSQKTELVVAARATRMLYQAYVDVGFTNAQAFELTKAVSGGGATGQDSS